MTCIAVATSPLDAGYSDGILTSRVNTRLQIDGEFPDRTQKVLVTNCSDDSGVYSVTDIGSESRPWVLKRANCGGPIIVTNGNILDGTSTKPVL